MAYLIETTEPLGGVKYTIGSRKIEQVEAHKLISSSRKIRTVFDRELTVGPFTQRIIYDVKLGAVN